MHLVPLRPSQAAAQSLSLALCAWMRYTFGTSDGNPLLDMERGSEWSTTGGYSQIGISAATCLSEMQLAVLNPFNIHVPRSFLSPCHKSEILVFRVVPEPLAKAPVSLWQLHDQTLLLNIMHGKGDLPPLRRTQLGDRTVRHQIERWFCTGLFI
jgi:hypothetical protein